jgi:phage tail sheath gpL-like
MILVRLQIVTYFIEVITLLIVENAKLFKEDLLRRNVKNSNALNL